MGASGRRAHQDHPRSRGVYVIIPTESGAGHGSSPLARGLLQCPPGLGGLLGIIPARAGFTGQSVGSPCAAADHPRSRGVYVGINDTWSWARGSSPLARGLHERRGQGSHSPGIIPARAGFTGAAAPPGGPPPGPPRARGGVAAWSGRPDRDDGSSPLARGLHRPGVHGQEVPRIIPARAGFTMMTAGQSGISRDHPRSRGVYRKVLFGTARAAGSSPLARGLPSETRTVEKGLGSSPLARGLRRDAPGAACTRGIIPARAGFTCPTG